MRNLDRLHLGYIKLYRRLLDSRVFLDEFLLKVWIWVLLKASHRERSVPFKTGKGMSLVTLQPGQLIFGRKSAARDLGAPAETVRGRMAKLRSLGMVTIQPTTHYSLITVVNWHPYQGSKNSKDAQPPPTHHIQECCKKCESRPGPAAAHSDPQTSGAAPLLPLLENNSVAAPAQRRHHRRRGCDYPAEIVELWNAYCDTIVRVPAKKADTLRNIAARVKEGYTVRQLGIAMENYSDTMPEDPELRYHPNNFFGKKAYFQGFLSDTIPESAKEPTRE